MLSTPVFEAASISIRSVVISRLPARQFGHLLHGFSTSSEVQLAALASRRAALVLPTPRGPVKRYACEILPDAMAFLSVRTTGSWPTSSSNVCERYLR